MLRTSACRRSVAHALASLALASGFVTGTTQAAEPIVMGMSTALNGPASALGQGVRLGVDAYFAQVNKAGGVNGHALELVPLDDGYEPKRAAENMRTLVDKNVVAVLGNVGTPTAIVTVPIANEQKTLLFGAFTGAGVLRKSPPDRYVINYRASYAQETAAMVDGLLKAGVKPEEIAFFTQKDGYGDAGYNGAMKALLAKGFTQAKSLPHGRYERNTTNVEDGLGTLLSAEVEPKAVIIVGAYKPVAKFIKLAKADLPETLFLNVSFVGSNALKKALGEDGEGVIVTQVVPHFNANLAGVTDYRKALKAFKADAEPSFVSLEGYLVARLFVEGLKSVKGEINRESVVDALEQLQMDLEIGVQVAYSKANHQASNTVWPTAIRSGAFQPLDWSSVKVAAN